MSKTHSLHSSSMHKPSASPTPTAFCLWFGRESLESFFLINPKLHSCLVPLSQTKIYPSNRPCLSLMTDWQIRCHSKIIPPGTITLVMPILIVWYRYPCIIFYWFTRIYFHCSFCCCSSCSMIDKRVLKSPKVSGTQEGIYWRHMNLSMVKCE